MKDKWVALCSAILLIILDQYTKFLAVTHLKDQSDIPLIKDVFELHYLENRGAAFGMLQNQKMFFILAAIIILTVVVVMFLKLPNTTKYQPLRCCLVLVSAGAIGNMIDRVRLNYVIDFLYFKWIDFPVFNVADIYVTVAAILLFALILFYYKDEDFDTIFHVFSKKEQKR